MPSASLLDEGYTECARLVREGDPDRFLAGLFVPAAKRRHLYALYAFNLETARIRDQVRQPLTGEIRLQWWRDTLEEAANSPDESGKGHPVAAALIDTTRNFGLPGSAFQRLLEGRIFDLYDDPMPSREAFEAYAGETASTLIMLSGMVLDASKAPAIATAAGHAGVAQLAAGVLRSLPIHRARGQVFIPADILAAVACPAEALLRGDPEPSLRAIQAMTAFGRDHLRSFRDNRAHVPPSLLPAFLPASLADPYLASLERAGLASLTSVPDIGPIRRTWTYWRAMRA